MAKKTGHTNAGTHRATGSTFAPSRTRVCCYVVVLSLVWAISPGNSFANGPVGKPRYRGTSQGRSSGETDTRKGKPAAKKGLGGFSLRALLGGKRSAKAARKHELLSAVPMERLTPQAKQKLAAITDKPALYRQLPTQAIRCDEELFLFLTRKPEAIVGIWDLMGITQVQTSRLGPYKMNAIDGCGTTCEIDLLYGDRNLHVFMADGGYDGKFTQKPIRGKGVFVFKSTYAIASDGSTTVNGTLDCYIKFESLGADLLARSLGGLIGKSADHNFIETAKFISQISQACETNPEGMLEMIDRLPQVDPQTKREFAQVIMNVARRSLALKAPAAKLVRERGIMETPR